MADSKIAKSKTAKHCTDNRTASHRHKQWRDRRGGGSTLDDTNRTVARGWTQPFRSRGTEVNGNLVELSQNSVTLKWGPSNSMRFTLKTIDRANNNSFGRSLCRKASWCVQSELARCCLLRRNSTGICTIASNANLSSLNGISRTDQITDQNGNELNLRGENLSKRFHLRDI